MIRGRTLGPPLSATAFPGAGSVLPVAQQSYRGGESPDPLAPCSGYEDGGINTGTPLFALLPQAPTAGSVTATVTRDGVIPVDVVRLRRDQLHEPGRDVADARPRGARRAVTR